MRGQKPRVFVEVDQRFGRLVVIQTGLHTGQSPKKSAGWRAAMCRCDCGTEVTVAVSHLVSGRNKSCGCLLKDASFSAEGRRAGIAFARSAEGRARAARMRAEQTPEQAARRDAKLLAHVRSPEGRAHAAGLRSRQTPEQAARREANRKPPPVNYRHGLAANPLYRLHAAMMRRCYDEDWPGYRNWGGRGVRVNEAWHDVRVFIAAVEAEIGPRPEGRTPGGMPVYTLDRIDNDGNYEPGNVRWATMAEQSANSRRHKLLSPQ
jgi:hypothetical protein